MKFFRLFYPQKDSQDVIRENSIPSKLSWNIELNKNGFVATSKELPGLVTNGKDPEELLEMMNDAVLEYFDVSKLDSDYIFDTLDLQGTGTVFLKQAKQKKQYA